MSTEGYFFVADLLGFGNIIKNLSDDNAEKRIEDWVDLVTRATNEAGVEKFQLISDTLFAATPGTSEGLGQLVKLARHLLNEGVPKSFPLRGAITYGTYTWGSLIYGKSVIDAHLLEMAQDWIGVSGAPDIPHIDVHLSFDSLVMYMPPKRTGRTMIQPVVDWNVPTVHALFNMLGGGGLLPTNGDFNWELAHKANNTVLFSLYRDAIKKAGISPKVNWGFSSLEVLEPLLNAVTKT